MGHIDTENLTPEQLRLVADTLNKLANEKDKTNQPLKGTLKKDIYIELVSSLINCLRFQEHIHWSSESGLEYIQEQIEQIIQGCRMPSGTRMCFDTELNEWYDEDECYNVTISKKDEKQYIEKDVN